MNAWRKCPECGLTHGRHSSLCPADDWLRGRLAAEARLDDTALDRAVKAVQQATREAVQLGTGIWQIHYEPQIAPPPLGTAGGAGSAPSGGGGGGGAAMRDNAISGNRDSTLSRDRASTLSGNHDSAKAPADVTNPGHYRAHPSGVECITITEHMGFNLGNAVKYIWRADLKHETPLDDLKKARWYLDREIKRQGGDSDAGGSLADYLANISPTETPFSKKKVRE